MKFKNKKEKTIEEILNNKKEQIKEQEQNLYNEKIKHSEIERMEELNLKLNYLETEKKQKKKP